MADESTRRSFVEGALGAVVTTAAGTGAVYEITGLAGRAENDGERKWAEVGFTVNGEAVKLRVPHERTLLLVLREDLGLTAAKKGCNLGHCGACTVLVDGLPVYACLMLALDAAGRDIVTLEGLRHDGGLHPVQQGFIEKMGSQCGHCTPGMILSAAALLERNPAPSVDEIKVALSGHLCRCGNYPHEIASVQWAAARRTGEETYPTTLDARAKAAGEARYTGDLGFHPDDPVRAPLIAKVLRSPHPHAEIVAVDDSRARQLKGYRGLVTWEDVPGWRERTDRNPMNPKARYVGDAIAAVAADDQYTAQRALELVEVRYRKLRPYPNAEKNLADGLTAIHEGTVAGFGRMLPAGAPTVEFSSGDVKAGFAQAEQIVEGRYVTQLQCHVPIETHCAIARWQGQELTVWDTQQSIHHARRVLAEVLRVNPEHVRVVCAYVGGGFGGKCTDTRGKTLYQAIAALLAKKTGRPVRLEYTLKEEMFAEDTRNPFVFYLKTGVKKDGTITALECRAIQATGGYASSGPAVCSVAGEGIINTYRTGSYSYRGFSVYTNSPVGGEMRGFGHPQAVFARESHMDEVAEAIGMNPLEFRLRNTLRAGDRITLGVAKDITLGNVGADACLRLGAKAIGWERWEHPSKKTGRVRRGLGLRLSQEHSGRDSSDGLVWRGRDGRIHVPLGVGNIGTEAHTGIALIVAEALGVPVSALDVTWTDSSDTAWDFVTDASRSVHCHGKAMYNAARDLRRQLETGPKRSAAELVPNYDAATDINPILDEGTGEITKRPVPRLSRATEALARRLLAEGATVGLGYYIFNPGVQGWGASFAEVEVDMETGQVRVLKLVGAHDVGRVIHRPGAEAQVHGGGIMGLGYAMTEDLVLDPHTGIPVCQTLYEYRPPTILDVPHLAPILVEAPAEAGPFGAKGLGENPMFDAAAAAGNAIYNATGVRVRRLPFTWRRVYDELKRAGRLVG